VLEVDCSVQVGTLALDVSLSVADGEVVALLGPNGAGKSTALRAVAGLQPIDRGTIRLDGATLDDPATGEFVPPEHRPIGLVFQDHVLFPRMSALENVAFGLRARGVARAEAREAAAAWLDRFGISDHAARPSALSGGQSQRVALARTLATEPRLLLLDEPLASLDASIRGHVRSELRRQLATFGGGRLLVTHDPLDALVLADRLVVLEQGSVTQTGTAAEVALRPRTRYVADLLGVCLIDAESDGDHAVKLASGARLTVADPVPGSRIAVAVRPRAVSLHRHRPEGSARNVWPATVRAVEAEHDRVRVGLDGPVPVTAEVTPAAVAELGLAPGAEVWASIKAVDLTCYEH
jgi:molybdate transport system ATP-binding protein